MIAAHAWRTAQTLGYARSQRSNHLITEAVGLWTAGTLYPELREARFGRTRRAISCAKPFSIRSRPKAFRSSIPSTISA